LGLKRFLRYDLRFRKPISFITLFIFISLDTKRKGLIIPDF